MQLKKDIAAAVVKHVHESVPTGSTYRKSILIVGLFLTPQNQHRILRSAADQLGELLDKYGYKTIKVSTRVNQLTRFADTMVQVVVHAFKYKVAIVPLYGGYKSHLWQNATSILLRMLGKKVVLVVHGGSIPMRMQSNSNKYMRSFRRVQQVVCPSPFIASTLHNYQVPATIIENVVNLSDYTFHSKKTFRPRLLWMRTFEDIYNPEMAVNVAAILVKKYPGLRMVMAGYDRGSLKMIKQMIERLGLQEHIELPGYISNHQKNEYAQDLDIYICTNRIDNAPVSFVEMMALGLPIVSVSVGGIPFLVEDGINALLVPLDNAPAMADKIAAIIEQPELGERLATNAVKFAKKFDEQPVLEKWIEVLRQLDSGSFTNSR